MSAVNFEIYALLAYNKLRQKMHTLLLRRFLLFATDVHVIAKKIYVKDLSFSTFCIEMR